MNTTPDRLRAIAPQARAGFRDCLEMLELHCEEAASIAAGP